MPEPVRDTETGTGVFSEPRPCLPPSGGAGAKGVGIWAWAQAANLTNISSVSGSQVGDYFVNTGTATRTMLGVAAEPGDLVKSTTAAAGTAAGSIKGPQGAAGTKGADGKVGTSFWAWDQASSLSNISSVPGSQIGDYFINTGNATRTMLGLIAAPGDVVKSLTAISANKAGYIRGGKGTSFIGTTVNMSGLRDIYVVNTNESATVNIQGIAAAPGDVVYVDDASVSSLCGNIKGPSGITFGAGFIKFANNLAIAWGTVEYSPTGVGSLFGITFSLTFKDPPTVVFTHLRSAGGASNCWVYLRAVRGNSFDCFVDNIIGLHWIAIGEAK